MRLEQVQLPFSRDAYPLISLKEDSLSCTTHLIPHLLREVNGTLLEISEHRTNKIPG